MNMPFLSKFDSSLSPAVPDGSRRPLWLRHLRTSCLSLVIFLSSLSWLWADETKPDVQVTIVASAKSTFMDDPNFGKDPFFPKSKRREPTVVQTNAVVEISVPELLLKGISGSKERRLALIGTPNGNSYTFGVGEAADMKIGNQPVPVRCVEIRDKAVIISVRGQTKELRLRQGL